MAGSTLPLFVGRVLPLALAGTPTYAARTARARAAGQAEGLALVASDGFAAAVAAGLTVTARASRFFEAAEVAVIPLWRTWAHPTLLRLARARA